jgi:hypothetical protein
MIIIGSWIHDPIYRNLINEENSGDYEKRIWCVVSYPTNLQINNSFISTFHFVGPFTNNLVSIIFLLTKKSRQELIIHPDQIYRKILFQQFREHRDLLTGPIVLIILAFPHLIIAFVSKCMKSADDPWLFLFAYFIPFVPPIITFIIFIMPSKFYMKVFTKNVKRYRTSIQRRFIWTSQINITKMKIFRRINKRK